MRRLFIVVVMVAALASGALLFAGEWATSSGLITSSQAIVAKPAGLTGVMVVTNGVTPVSLALCDGSSQAGTTKFTVTVPGTSYSMNRIFVPPVIFNNGIYAVLSGTSGQATVEFIQER